MQFRWIDWNIEHVAEHGVSEEEAEMVVRSAKRRFRGRSATRSGSSLTVESVDGSCR